MALISFTRKHADRSSSTGFQFEFFCDVCSSSHMTAFQYDSVGVASTLLSAAEILLRRGSRFGAAGEQVNRLLRGKAWDEAYTHAVEEAKQTFKHCTRCSSWVCADNCWTAEHNQCRKCTPDLAVEAPSMQAQAGKWQMFGKALQSDQTGGRDMSHPQLADCPHCGARTKTGGEFCTNCGKVITADVHCKKCESKWPSHKNYQFCPGCGASFSDETQSEPAVQHEPEPEPVVTRQPEPGHEHKIEHEPIRDLEPEPEPEVEHKCEPEVARQVQPEVKRGPDSVQVTLASSVVSQDEVTREAPKKVASTTKKQLRSKPTKVQKEPTVSKSKAAKPKAQSKRPATAKPKKETTVVAKSKTKSIKPSKAKAAAKTKVKTKAAASKAVRKTSAPKTVSKTRTSAAKPKTATKAKAATKSKAATKAKAATKPKVAKPKVKVKAAKPKVVTKANAATKAKPAATKKAKPAKTKAAAKPKQSTKAKPTKAMVTKPKTAKLKGPKAKAPKNKAKVKKR